MKEELTAQQRGVVIYKALLTGPKRVLELQELSGLSQRGVYFVLENISYREPLTNVGGHWYLLTTDEQRDAWRVVERMECDLAQLPVGTAFTYALPARDAGNIVRLLKRFLCAPEPD